MDDPDCDSTWEDDEDAEGDEGGEDGQAGAAGDADDWEEDEDEDVDPEGPLAGLFQPRTRNRRAMQDMRRYRHHYPDLVERDCNGEMPNLSFYKNEIRFLPNGCYIEDILQNWKDNYDLLEDNHSYIQWLFPLREPGVNWHAKPLTLKEIEAFKSSAEVKERFIRAYELMLGFYGIQLEDRDTGAVCRAQNYHRRFQNLNWHSHNNLRITRILKSLGELGLEHYQAPLVHFFLEETLARHELPGVRQSALDYFLFAVRCRRQRRELVHFAWENFRPRCKFVWGPQDKLRRFRPQAAAQPLADPGQAEGNEGPGDPPQEAPGDLLQEAPGDTLQEAPRDPLKEAGTQGPTPGPGRDPDGDSEATEGSQPLSAKAQDAGSLEGDPRDGDEAEPPSPKESKKRKLEANRQEQAPGEPGPQGPSEVEKIALNLEECALSQGSQDLGETEQPCPQPLEARVADEVRKRRKVEEEGAGGDGEAVGGNTPMPAPAPPECPKVQKDGNEVKEDPESQAGSEEGARRAPSEGPGPATAGTLVDEMAEAAGMAPSAEPRKP